ncbi:hypothetical protein Prum_084750 [Phytohabitans rumicis]|uniref:Uncharacterized protein n=1 Tax=Phytohabitans rumicis TaxID=1076125 RepID=A0A6V8LC85_9ACTN|nr:hypothetical protein Prum_084750 [Phytohabitans rumicis]
MRAKGRRALAAAAVAVALSAAAVVVGPGSAGYAVSGRVNVYGGTPMNSDPKDAVATCPGDTKVLGGAGYISNGFGDVVLDRIVPNADLTSVSVRGLEHGGVAGAWSATAVAMCGDPVLNLRRVSYELPRSWTSPKNAVAYCPGNLSVYGLGAQIVDGRGDVVLDDLEISDDLSFVNVGAYQVGDPNHAWGLVAYAICGNRATTMERVVASPASGSDNASPKSVHSASCPAGTTQTGVGGEVSGGRGAVTLDELTVSAVAGGVAQVRAHDNGTGAGPWNVLSYSVCAA